MLQKKLNQQRKKKTDDKTSENLSKTIQQIDREKLDKKFSKTLKNEDKKLN